MAHSQLISRRIKRLKYWQEQFQSNSKVSPVIIDLLNTYNLLISKMAKASDPSDIEQSESRLSTIERELATTFESYRLLTTTSGISAVKDTY